MIRLGIKTKKSEGESEAKLHRWVGAFVLPDGSDYIYTERGLREN
jgi:hypothetical protein